MVDVGIHLLHFLILQHQVVVVADQDIIELLQAIQVFNPHNPESLVHMVKEILAELIVL
jgi:type III secretion system FlhB-like substrate exporter